jgi:hypothetical protein
MKIDYRCGGINIRSSILLIVLVITVSVASAQIAEKPKAFVFDEFGQIGRNEVIKRTLKFREEIIQRETADGYTAYYIFFYRGETERSTENVKKTIVNALLSSCRDCMGFGGPRITFVEAGEMKQRLVQFWIVPRDAEAPTPVALSPKPSTK